MSEIIPQGEWAEPEVMQQWREVVAKRASLTMGGDGGTPTKAMCMEAKFPEASARALYLLSETDLSKNEIARQCGFMKIQLDRLAMANAPTLEHNRPELAKRFTNIAKKTAVVLEKRLERLMEDNNLLDATPINHLAILAGVSVDKAAALSGVATNIVEHRVGLSLDDAAKMIEAARARATQKLKGEAIEAEVVK